MSINVSNKEIDLKLTSENSAACYWGYKVDYHSQDSSLYIRIKSKIIPLPGVSSKGFNLSIPNTYVNIKKIYLEDSITLKYLPIWESK